MKLISTTIHVQKGIYARIAKNNAADHEDSLNCEMTFCKNCVTIVNLVHLNVCQYLAKTHYYDVLVTIFARFDTCDIF